MCYYMIEPSRQHDMNAATKEAFLAHYEPLHERFARFCASQAFGLMTAEDLMQEAVLAALQGFERLKDKTKLLGYLIGTVNNIVRNQRRRSRFTGNWDEKLAAELEDRLPDPATLLDVQYLLKALGQLPEALRETLILFEVSGFTVREIAEIQQTSEGAVKTRLSRTRQTLREMLAEDGRPMPLSKRLAIYTSILL